MAQPLLLSGRMNTTTIRNIVIGIYVLLVLGFSAMAKAEVSAGSVEGSSVKVSPFSY